MGPIRQIRLVGPLKCLPQLQGTPPYICEEDTQVNILGANQSSAGLREIPLLMPSDMSRKSEGRRYGQLMCEGMPHILPCGILSECGLRNFSKHLCAELLLLCIGAEGLAPLSLGMQWGRNTVGGGGIAPP